MQYRVIFLMLFCLSAFADVTPSEGGWYVISQEDPFTGESACAISKFADDEWAILFSVSGGIVAGNGELLDMEYLITNQFRFVGAAEFLLDGRRIGGDILPQLQEGEVLVFRFEAGSRILTREIPLDGVDPALRAASSACGLSVPAGEGNLSDDSADIP